ncbi:MAG: purine-binding chemotaxis protein CheW [Nitrospinae bacterium]|nr:purine-binding chemotaxis protein CheW [Nitrospinota bacterium]
MNRFRIRQEREVSPEKRELHRQFIGIRLGAEEYIIEITKAREILVFDGITYVPRVAGHFEGVINLRGDVVPVINLRAKLGMAAVPLTPGARIIIAESASGAPVGLLVDAVTTVIHLPESGIEPASAAVGEVAAEYIKGIGRAGGSIVGWLDVDKLVA